MVSIGDEFRGILQPTSEEANVGWEGFSRKPTDVVIMGGKQQTRMQSTMKKDVVKMAEGNNG